MKRSLTQEQQLCEKLEQYILDNSSEWLPEALKKVEKIKSVIQSESKEVIVPKQYFAVYKNGEDDYECEGKIYTLDVEEFNKKFSVYADSWAAPMKTGEWIDFWLF